MITKWVFQVAEWASALYKLTFQTGRVPRGRDRGTHALPPNRPNPRGGTEKIDPGAKAANARGRILGRSFPDLPGDAGSADAAMLGGGGKLAGAIESELRSEHTGAPRSEKR